MLGVVRTARGTARAAAAQARRLASVTTTDDGLLKTAFYDMHLELGGKMVPFAGYALPVQYAGEKGGVLKEHVHCRSDGCAALFDVSHMGQIIWRGADHVAFLEKMVVGDIAGLGEGEARLSLIMNEAGGIVDDTVITKCPSYTYMVVNGATKFGDMEHFRTYMDAFDGDVSFEYLEDRQLLAVQGPGAAQVVGRLVPDDFGLDQMAFMHGAVTTFAGIPDVRVTRCGYTGEDGFEISLDVNRAVEAAEILLQQPEVAPTGLGARDSLRLEAGLCLYGNDIDHTINPNEAGLVWTVGGPKSRRRKEQGFLGASAFLAEDGKLLGVSKKRVGLTGMKAPARQHTIITTPDGGEDIGEVTSGTFGPTFQGPVAMGYVPKEYAKEGTEVGVKVRGKVQKAVVTKMPFVPSRYYKP